MFRQALGFHWVVYRYFLSYSMSQITLKSETSLLVTRRPALGSGGQEQKQAFFEHLKTLEVSTPSAPPTDYNNPWAYNTTIDQRGAYSYRGEIPPRPNVKTSKPRIPPP